MHTLAYIEEHLMQIECQTCQDITQMWLLVGSVIPGLKYLEGVYDHVVTGDLARGMTPATPQGGTCQ
jgi:hypothetical protein